MIPRSFDTETKLIRPGLLAPPLVCASTALASDSYGLFHHTEARPFVEKMLGGDELLVGHHIAYDMAVIAAKWPDLLPLIFDVYAADRVSDTGIREKLNHIALGVYRRFEHSDGSWEKLNYALEDLARRHLGVVMEKGGWQLRFGELMDVPLALWPEEASEYAIGDAVITLEVWKKQEQDRQYLEDEFRQARSEFWLYLMSCWGLRTDLVGVREFARQTQQQYDEIASTLVEVGLLRPRKLPKKPKKVPKKTPSRWQRSTKAVQARMVLACAAKGKKVELTKGGKKSKPQVKINADCCERSGDLYLEKYAELSSLTKTISTDIPLLMRGATGAPLQARFEVLLETGRTSSKPNVQNLPTEQGVRECFVPRPGWVYASADYSGFELRTWSQVCISVGFGSKMAEALNAGMDPHIEVARRILGIPYEEAVADYEADPKGRVYYPRQCGKVANFGMPGGLGAERFVDYARTSYGVIVEPKLAVELKQIWLASWPEAQLYFDWISSQCESAVPVIKQLFSNRYRGDVGFCDGANSLFQGLAADAAKASGFLIAKACYADRQSPLYDCRPVDFVHDEFIVEVPDDEFASDAAEELAHLMIKGASPFLPDVPPVCKPMLARRWSKAAKPVRVNGRLVPWDFPVKQAAE